MGSPIAQLLVADLDGAPAGALVFWDRGATAPPGALRVDGRVLGASPVRHVSLCRMPPAMSLAFDDPMVAGALRRRLSLGWPGFASTLLVDWSRIGGALTAAPTPAGVADDPFASVFPRLLLEVEAGTLGEIPPPTGPVISRYGSGNPWPWDRYRGQVA